MVITDLEYGDILIGKDNLKMWTYCGTDVDDRHVIYAPKTDHFERIPDANLMVLFKFLHRPESIEKA
jgi:hypothetical protein